MSDTQMPRSKVESFQRGQGSFGFIRLPNPRARRRTFCRIIRLKGELATDGLIGDGDYVSVGEVSNCKEARMALRFLRMGWRACEAALPLQAPNGSAHDSGFLALPEIASILPLPEGRIGWRRGTFVE